MTESRIGLEDWPAAIERTDGRQMVVAGPGTGKTEFLVRRVAHILESGKAKQDEIVVLCFSRRAAGALRARIEDLVGGTGLPVDVATFHSLALRIGETIDDGPPPTPLTTPEQIDFVARTLAQEDPDTWPTVYRGILGSRAFASEVADFMMRCSERLLTPNGLADLARDRSDWRGLPGLYRRYLARLEEAGRTDYGVLLASTVASLSGARGRELSDRYRYVLVDEYQDTTPAQAEMARLLSANHGNLTVAGDPYQSIYSFRGSELANIADFSAAGAERLVLTQSFRVPEEIMTSALRVVAGADLPGAAGPVIPASHPGRIEAHVFDQETAEAEWIAAEVEQAILVGGIRPSEIAVLLRSKKELLDELSRALDRRGIPHDPPESRLVDHPAVGLIRDVVTVALTGGSLPTTTAVESASADRAMRRVLLGPAVGLALGKERSLLRARRRTWEPWAHVIAERLHDRPGLTSLLSDHGWASGQPATDGFWHLWTTLEGIDELVDDPDRGDWRQAWAAFAQTLARQAERDPSVTLAEYFALTDDEDFEADPMITVHLPGDRVTLTTLHQAKGLEFEMVIIANATEGTFPDLRRSRKMLRPELLAAERTTDPLAQHVFQVQEEIRLAYTAMTRARSRVVWTATQAGGDLGERRPSRFLVAASGKALNDLGPPGESDRDPITLVEAETMLRRWLLDPTVPAVNRLAALTMLAGHDGGWWRPRRFPGVAEPGPDRPINSDTVRLSPSQAGAYQTCPRHYALEKRLRIGDSDSPYARFGTLIHTTLERAESEVLGSGARHAQLSRALEILGEVWEDADFGTPALNEAWLKKGGELLEKLYTRWPGTGVPIDLEREVTAEIGGVVWKGYVDRVEQVAGGLAVVDYKTSTSPVTQEEAAGSIQLAFYAMAVGAEGQPVVDAQFWYPRSRAQSVSVVGLDMSRLSEVEDGMAGITEGVVSEQWDPRVGSHCSRCSFRMTCPEWPEGKGAYLP